MVSPLGSYPECAEFNPLARHQRIPGVGKPDQFPRPLPVDYDIGEAPGVIFVEGTAKWLATRFEPWGGVTPGGSIPLPSSIAWKANPIGSGAVC